MGGGGCNWSLRYKEVSVIVWVDLTDKGPGYTRHGSTRVEEFL